MDKREFYRRVCWFLDDVERGLNRLFTVAIYTGCLALLYLIIYICWLHRNG